MSAISGLKKKSLLQKVFFFHRTSIHVKENTMKLILSIIIVIVRVLCRGYTDTRVPRKTIVCHRSHLSIISGVGNNVNSVSLLRT